LNGEGGIRTPGDLSATSVFETVPANPQPLAISGTCDNRQIVLADCLALFSAFDPRLALLIERWAVLPEPVRAGIVAMVKAACPDAEPSGDHAAERR